VTIEYHGELSRLHRNAPQTRADESTRGNNGQVSYTLDNVGNRLQRNSTLPSIVATGC
jgi:hypothetical protein